MNDLKMTNSLSLTWVTVTDTRGRTRLEARWTTDPHDDAPVHATQAVHAA